MKFLGETEILFSRAAIAARALREIRANGDCTSSNRLSGGRTLLGLMGEQLWASLEPLGMTLP